MRRQVYVEKENILVRRQGRVEGGTLLVGRQGYEGGKTFSDEARVCAIRKSFY